MKLKLIPKGYLRYMILHVLREENLTGYQIMKRIKEFTGFWKPSPGSLYPILKSMEKEGLIKRKDKKYEVTEKGRKVEKRLELSREKWKKSMMEFFAEAGEVEKEKIEKEIEKIRKQKIDDEIVKYIRIFMRSIVEWKDKEAVKKFLKECIKKMRSIKR